MCRVFALQKGWKSEGGELKMRKACARTHAPTHPPTFKSNGITMLRRTNLLFTSILLSNLGNNMRQDSIVHCRAKLSAHLGYSLTSELLNFWSAKNPSFASRPVTYMRTLNPSHSTEMCCQKSVCIWRLRSTVLQVWWIKECTCWGFPSLLFKVLFAFRTGRHSWERWFKPHWSIKNLTLCLQLLYSQTRDSRRKEGTDNRMNNSSLTWNVAIIILL